MYPNYVSKSVGSSPVLTRRDDNAGSNPLSSGSSVSLDDELPPIPSPRSASLLHNPSPPHVATPVSPLAMSQISAHHLSPPPPTASSAGGSAVAAASKVIPLAIAIHETCNAIFMGASMSNCVVKVTGEVVLSFPTSFLPMLGSYEPLIFRVNPKDKVERLLHNQHLLKQ